MASTDWSCTIRRNQRQLQCSKFKARLADLDDPPFRRSVLLVFGGPFNEASPFKFSDNDIKIYASPRVARSISSRSSEWHLTARQVETPVRTPISPPREEDLGIARVYKATFALCRKVRDQK